MHTRAVASSKRTAGRNKTPAEPAAPHVPDLVVRGLTAADIALLEAETERRRAALPRGAKITRNAVAVAIFHEALLALDAKAKARESGG